MTFTALPVNSDGSVKNPVSSTGSSTDFASQKDMFLKMLVAQLQNQDPSAPMDQKDMMAQMSQMTSVEQLTNMAQTMTSLQTNASVSQSLTMIGHNVDYLDSSGALVQNATVKSVALSGNSVNLVFDNGTFTTPSNVVVVR